MKITKSTLAALAIGTGLTLTAGLLIAQAPALQRTIVAKADVSRSPPGALRAGTRIPGTRSVTFWKARAC